MAVQRRDPQEPFGLHAHEFSEIVIITGGQGVHITGEDTYGLKAGDTFVIGGSRPHDYLDLDKLRLINVLIDTDELAMDVSDLQSLPGFHALFTLEPAWRKRHQFNSRLQLSPHELVQAIRLVDQLEAELDERSPGFGIMATTLLLQLAAFLSRCYNQTHNPKSKSLLRIAETIAHIERHYSDPISLDELIEMSGMSRRNFLRAFESTMGHSPIKYLIRIRIRQACKLLERDDLSITQIAMQVGFSDSNYFSRQFRSLMGLTPRNFRKRNLIAAG
ncbi:helix-turn-helix domain-containing protein [Rubripirellula obstinata]|uniref:helix-turn-helix domain-containing protein n=1 Tax=Rubripirellula obstinata TaxID=406547 RepID=UPI0021BCAD18|nr:helix-turn-helix domain-containing protein [Rubripirellula obstinata]